MPNLPYSSTASLPFGSRVLTINAITYVAQSWNPQKSTREINREDENGDENAFMLRAAVTRQSGIVLQLATSSTAVPTMGQEFTVDSLTYVITAVGKVETQGAFHTVSIDVRAKVLPTD